MIEHVRRHVRMIEAVTDTERGRITFDVTEQQARRIATMCNTSFKEAMRVAGRMKETGTPGETALWSVVTSLVSDLSQLEFAVICGDDPRNKDLYIVTRDKIMYMPA